MGSSQRLLIICKQYEKTADLVDRLAAGANKDDGETFSTNSDMPDFTSVRDALLKRAGGSLSLTEAAKLLGVSRQALHKRILAGTALGMMVDTEIAVPRLQIVETNKRRSVLPGIDVLTKLFKEAEAGPWMALQFLVDPDPNLGRPPIEELQQGKKDAVIRAARAHLRLDEE